MTDYNLKIGTDKLNSTKEAFKSSSDKDSAVYIPAMHNETKDTVTLSSKKNKIKIGILAGIALTVGAVFAFKKMKNYKPVMQAFGFGFGFKKAKPKPISDINLDRQRAEAQELLRKQQGQLNDLYKDLLQKKSPKK